MTENRVKIVDIIFEDPNHVPLKEEMEKIQKFAEDVVAGRIKVKKNEESDFK